VIIVDELGMADVKFMRVMRSCYSTRTLPRLKVSMRSTSDAPTIADEPVGDTNLKNKALDYYKDLILAIISTSALLITISLTSVTLSYTTNLLGVSLRSRTMIGYSSFLFLLSIIFSTFSYQRMVGLLNAGENFYGNRLFRAFLLVGWLTYVLGAVFMFIGIYILIYGGVV
jgi:hypothetical protein